jgi:alpha/beta superfamily hydrolase
MLLVPVGIIGAFIAVVLGGGAGLIAARPRLQRQLFGQPAFVWDPATRCDRIDVEGHACWVSRADEQPEAIALLIHGFTLAEDPASADRNMAAVFEAFNDRGVKCLLPNLAYTSSGYFDGTTEVHQIASTADWARTTYGRRVVVYAVSAGGTLALLAASTTDSIARIVTDSAFVDFGSVAATEAARATRIPRSLFLLTPSVVRRLVRLERTDTVGVRVPLRLYHGAQDEAVPLGDAHRLANLGDHAELRLVDGASHGCASHDAELTKEMVEWLLRN